jgi:hypothetical protein
VLVRDRPACRTPTGTVDDQVRGNVLTVVETDARDADLSVSILAGQTRDVHAGPHLDARFHVDGTTQHRLKDRTAARHAKVVLEAGTELIRRSRHLTGEHCAEQIGRLLAQHARDPSPKNVAVCCLWHSRPLPSNEVVVRGAVRRARVPNPSAALHGLAAPVRQGPCCTHTGASH